MNKYALHVAGGALLATTALASGTVYAATIKVIQATPGYGSAGGNTAITSASVPIATNVLTATGSTITVGPATIIVDTSSAQSSFSGTQTTIQLNVTGAEFNTSFVPSVTIWAQENTTSGSLTIAATSIGAVPFVSTDRITLNNVTGVTFGAMVFSGIVFRNAQGLATAGNTVSLSGSILNSSGVLTIESITSATFLSARAGSSIIVSSGGSASISNTSSPTQFTTVTQAGTAATTVVLSTINFSETSPVGAALSNTQTLFALVSNYEVKLTHAVLSDPAVATVNYINAATIGRTPAQFVSGSVTFGTIAPVVDTEAGAVRTLTIVFNGTSQIANAAAGTTTVTPTTKAGSGVAAASGTAVALNRGGMNAIVNFFQPSNNSVQSFLRITNTGGTAGALTVTVRNSSTGASIGSYTTAPVPNGGTIQVLGSTLETQSSPAITPALGVQYDLTVSGAITGFVQHIGFNPTTGQVVDFSSFRKGSSGYND